MATICKDDDAGAIVIGDAVCVSGWDSPSNRPKVKRALASNLSGTNARTILGVVSAVPGGGGVGTVDLLVSGEVAKPSVTGLSAGAGRSRLVVTDYQNPSALLTCKLRHIDDNPPVPERFVVGSSDESGTLAIVLPQRGDDRLGDAAHDRETVLVGHLSVIGQPIDLVVLRAVADLGDEQLDLIGLLAARGEDRGHCRRRGMLGIRAGSGGRAPSTHQGRRPDATMNVPLGER